MPRLGPYSRLYRGPGTAEQDENRITCSVCGFPGINPYAMQGESMAAQGAVTIVTSGTKYVWDSPNESVTTQDYEAVVIPNSMSACPDCGAELFLSGRRGSAHAVRIRGG